MLAFVCIVLAALLIGSAWPLSASLRGRYSSQMYAGLAPGMVPGQAQEARIRQVSEAEVRGTNYAVQFHPPEGVDPRDVGLLLHRQVVPRDFAAAIVSLAVQGFLTLRKVDVADEDGPRRDDWVIHVDRQPRGRPPEAASWLLDYFEDEGNPVYLSQVKPRLREAFARLREEIVTTALARAYVREDPTGQRAPTTGLAVAAVACLLVAGALAGAGNPLAWTAGGGAGAFAITAGRVRGPLGRTADGTAAYFRTMGFRRYLMTAEANQLKVEEAAGIFSRFLPWAIAFDAVDHWTGVFKDVAAGVDDPEVLALWGPDLFWLAMMPDLALGAGVLLAGLDGALTDLGDFGADLFDGDGFGGSDDMGDGDMGGGDVGGGDGEMGDMGGGGGDMGDVGDVGGGWDFGDFFDF